MSDYLLSSCRFYRYKFRPVFSETNDPNRGYPSRLVLGPFYWSRDVIFLPKGRRLPGFHRLWEVLSTDIFFQYFPIISRVAICTKKAALYLPVSCFGFKT
jgi:hypothetical protein